MLRGTEPGLALVGEFVRTMESIADRRNREHYETYHVPPLRSAPLQAIPFANERIPDVEMAQMIELMETEGISLQEVAYRFHRPWHLVERSMVDYQLQWSQFIRQRMTR